MKTNLTINCTQEQLQQLQQLLSDWCRRFCDESENEKPAAAFDDSRQRASERRSEVVGNVKCEDVADRRDLSTTSVTRKSHAVNREEKHELSQ